MKKYWVWVVLFGLYLAFLTPITAWAAPPVAFTPWGIVKLNGENVPAGTLIRAYCAGVQYGYTETITYLGDSFFSMNVAGDDPETTEVKEGCYDGETVTFMVWDAVADQSAEWQSGTHELNLTATKPISDLALDKQIEGYDASTSPGPYLLVGSDLTFTYTVTNTGETVLKDVTIVDDNGTREEPDKETEVCVIPSLAVGASQTCTLDGTVQPGAYVNTAIANGTPPDNPPVTASASAYYFGVYLDTTLVKFTNGEDANQPPGEFLEEGDNVLWEYVVTNDGNVTLTELSVIDDQGVTVTCPKDILAPGELMTCTASGQAVPGQYGNIGTVTGTPPVGPDISAWDTSHYFGSAPDIRIIKRINGYRPENPSAPGLYLLVGDDITWTYEIENMGNVTLTSVTVVDDKGVSINCPKNTLEDGESMTCTASGKAVVGQYVNIGTVTGTPPVGTVVSASDTSYYYGADPAVEIAFKVNGQDANSAPGLYVLADSTLTLEYVVTNTGNVPLESLVVKRGATTVCTILSLADGTSGSCTDTINALIGQQSTSATVTATPPGGLSSVSDSDEIHYFGATLDLLLVKKTNGEVVSEPTGMYVETSLPVNWSYVLTNYSNVTLTNVTVVDDNGTPVNGEDDHTVCYGLTLTPGATHTCTWTKNAVEGAYSNIASATADPPSPLSPIQSEPASSHYFGVTLDVSFVKKTNGEDAKVGTGPLIGLGSNVEWTYTITSSSNVSLPFSVVDNPAVTISCPRNTLNPSDEVVCTASETAVAGQFANTATLTVTTPGSLDNLTMMDTSRYYGVVTGISIQKYTNGQNADASPGPLIKVGQPVTWSYEITNTGNVTLNNVSVVDDKEGAIDCPLTTLVAGDKMTCTETGTAVAGQYSNLAMVTANPPSGFAQVTDSDPSHYFGSEAGVSVKKLTNAVDIGVDPIPYILIGDPVNWTYIVKNVGNLQLTEIVVNDSDVSLVVTCPKTTLGPAEEMTCTANGTAAAGPYTNTGYVEAVPEGFIDKAQDSDNSAYFGASPSITITKYTNGVDAKTPEESPYIPVGEPVEFIYQITSQETAYIFTDIEVSDDSGVAVTCPMTTLEPGDDHIICNAESIAEPGLQGSAGHISAKVVSVDTGETFGTIHTQDSSHYFGYLLGLDLVKLTNGQLVQTPPGPELLVGSTVIWTYGVTNTSNVALSNLEVSDDVEGLIICPFTELEPADTMTCSVTGIVILGQSQNVAYASGLFNQELVESFSAISYYVGSVGFMFFLPLLMR